MTAQRSQHFEKLKAETFDLLVIGGGVTGAGIALDAASRGMKVALVEKRDFASGTSSKSTKLIHGGLRYLKQFEIGLVREVGRERAIVHGLAPRLVKSEKMLLPIIEGGTFGKFATSVGLWVYDFLAGVKGEDKRRMLTKNQVTNTEPLLRTDDLLGGGLYAEYRTDDARLTIELIKAAMRHDAVCVNYLEANDFNYKNGKITAAKCRDVFTGEEFPVAAKCIVSAAGPWVDDLRKIDKSLQGKRLFLSKGVHIVVAHERLPLRHSVYFDMQDGRMLFAIPRHRATYIGTTDTPYHGDVNNVFADALDVEYLLKGANAMFPQAKLTKNDVESTWAGLRPLIFEEGKSASEMSRKDEIFESETGLISIAGGKLTGYRKMAERIVNLVAKKLAAAGHGRFGSCKTTSLPLAEKPFKNAREVVEFQQAIIRRAEALNLPDYFTHYLVDTYGEDARPIIVKAIALEMEPELALMKTELSYCLVKEMVMKPADFFERRTGRLYFDIHSIERNLDAILDDFKKYFNWTDAQLATEKMEMVELLENVRRF
jgi:glycerol-3-phosphate dehydrogenase